MTFPKRDLSVCFILLIFFLGMTGCVQTIDVRSDGMPIPDHVVKLTNPETGIEVTYMLIRVYKYREGNEVLSMPDYIAVDVPHVINYHETERLELHVTVHNPKKVRYEMWEDYTLNYVFEKWPTYIQKCFYDGSLSINKYVSKMPIRMEDLDRVNAVINMRIDSGKSSILIGPVNYSLTNK